MGQWQSLHSEMTKLNSHGEEPRRGPDSDSSSTSPDKASDVTDSRADGTSEHSEVSGSKPIGEEHGERIWNSLLEVASGLESSRFYKSRQHGLGDPKAPFTPTNAPPPGAQPGGSTLGPTPQNIDPCVLHQSQARRVPGVFGRMIFQHKRPSLGCYQVCPNPMEAGSLHGEPFGGPFGADPYYSFGTGLG